MERRSLLDDDEVPPEGQENIFDDAFAADDDEDMVADGFRPGHNHDREGGSRQDQPESSTRAISEHYAPAAIPGPSRSSTRKSRSHENPFASPEDGDVEQLIALDQAPSGGSALFAHRSISSQSSHQFARTHSLRHGAGGPSHPYGMYPQGTLARTASVATASTAQPSQQATSPSGPQHPYGLYPQGVGEDLDDDNDAVQSSVPIGFPGHGQSFQRQRGPDGEEQDIIGFYGHTEQLPPYSRYPEDGPEKVPLLSAPEPPTASHTRAPVAGTDPGMSLMHTQLQPTTPPAQQQQQSMTDQSELNRQSSMMSTSSAEQDDRESSTEDSVALKKAWNEKSWKEKKKTRVCGIPCWWYLVAVSALVFILIVISGVIGGFVAGTQKAEQKLAPLPTTTGFDASVIATATITQPIPTGTFALNLGPPQEVEAECLIIPQQRPAWDCDLAFGNEVAVVVSAPNGGNQTGASLIYVPNGEQGALTYGGQAMQMDTQFSPFLIVQDNDDKEYGPALYFRSQYNKLVVVPENGLDLSTSKIKRDAPPDWYEDQVAGPSAKPWYCFFNDTLLEGFIYPSQQIRPLPPSYLSSSTPAWYSQITAAPTQTITTTLTMPTTTATYKGVASAFPKWLSAHYPDFNMTAYESAHPPSRKRDAPPSGPTGLTLYPYRMKIEERRLPGSPLPYCIQYQVLNDGAINWVPNSSGQQIVVQLSERDPPWRPVQYSATNPGRLIRKRDGGLGSCHCQWMSGNES